MIPQLGFELILAPNNSIGCADRMEMEMEMEMDSVEYSGIRQYLLSQGTRDSRVGREVQHIAIGSSAFIPVQMVQSSK